MGSIVHPAFLRFTYLSHNSKIRISAVALAFLLLVHSFVAFASCLFIHSFVFDASYISIILFLSVHSQHLFVEYLWLLANNYSVKGLPIPKVGIHRDRRWNL
jgi:hypothetical protein